MSSIRCGLLNILNSICSWIAWAGKGILAITQLGRSDASNICSRLLSARYFWCSLCGHKAYTLFGCKASNIDGKIQEIRWRIGQQRANRLRSRKGEQLFFFLFNLFFEFVAIKMGFCSSCCTHLMKMIVVLVLTQPIWMQSVHVPVNQRLQQQLMWLVPEKILAILKKILWSVFFTTNA